MPRTNWPGMSNERLADIIDKIRPAKGMDSITGPGGGMVYFLSPRQADALEEAATRIRERGDEGEG